MRNHLLISIGELVFSGCLRVLSLVRKYKLPARGDEPLVKAILEDWQRIMWEKDAANEPLVFVEDGRMVFRVEVPLPVESEEQ